MKRILTLATLLLTLWNVNAQSPCVIGSFSYELVREFNQQFFVKISQPADLVENYYVYINNQKYEQPKVDGGAFYFGPFPIDCANYVLKIQNKSNESCTIIANLGNVCSEYEDCGFESIRHEVISCNDQKIKLWLKFEPIHTGNVGFDLYDVSGNFIGFYKYSDLPVTVEYELLPGIHQALYIQDNDNDECAAKYEFEYECTTNEECKIYDISYSVPECNPNGIVYVSLDFKYENVKSEKFIVKGNGINYGTFAYAELPVRVGPITPECDKNYEFVVSDAEDSNCSNYIDDIRICCPGSCVLPKFEVVNIECNDQDLFFKLKLTSDLVNNSFKINVNNNGVPNYEIDFPYVYFKYSNNLPTINNRITICTNSITTSECCYTQEFIVENYCKQECEIGEIYYSVAECSATGTAYVKLDFKYDNVKSEKFIVKGNGVNYGSFAYAELPIQLGPIEANCDRKFEFVVVDAENPDCTNFVEGVQICCTFGCVLPKFEVVNVDCTDQEIFVKLKLAANLPIGDFKLSLNNHEITNYELVFPYIYFKAPNNSSSPNNKVTICTSIECCYSQEFSLEGCFDNECEIGEIYYSVAECNPNGVTYVKLDFKYDNVKSEKFIVKGNGVNYGTFAYSELPIKVGPIVADCDKKFEFVVIDAENPDCTNYVESVQICCPLVCNLPKFEVVNIECNENEINLKLKLTGDALSNDIRVFINNQIVPNFKVDFPYIYLEYPNTFTSINNKITICSTSVLTVECCYSQEFTLENCVKECKIGDLKITPSDCSNGDAVSVTLDFKYENPNSEHFYVYGNGKEYGKFAYKDLPVKLGPIEPNCDKNFEFAVIDTENPNCANKVGNIRICCEPHCQEPKFEIINIECGNAQVFMKLKFATAITNNNLLIVINNTIITEYRIDGHYVYLSFINYFDGIVNNISVCTTPTTNLECCYTQSFTLEDCYPSEDCKIGTIKIQPSDCNSVSTEIPYVILNFEYTNVGSKGFSVKGNGHNYGSFRYEDLPVKVQIGSNCDINYEFVIVDNEFESCKSVIEYGKICCENKCSFYANDIRTKCIEDILTGVSFRLHEATDPIKTYKVFVNDEKIAEISENNTFHEIETQIPINANDDYILTICDESCCFDYKLDVSQCIVPVECSIENISTTSISCGSAGLQFILDFEYKGNGSEKFELFSSAGLFNSYYYSDLPLKIENFPRSNNGTNLLFICDKASICCAGHSFQSGQCSPFLKDTYEISIKSTVHKFIKQNPVTEYLYLNSPETNTSYKIYDGDGNKVQEYKSQFNDEAVNITSLKSGLYYVQIRTKDAVTIEKFIIAR